jgi:integrase
MTQETRYQPYQIIRRKSRKGKTVFYVRFVDTRTGRTIKEKSSGQTSRTAATRWAEVEYQKMQDSIVEAQTVSAIADGFWDWDAPYARGRRARGKSISHGTLDVAHSNTENHIIPRWGETLVSEITAAEVDEWILSLHGKRQLSTGTITKILQTFRTLLDGAVKQGMIRVNPAKAVEPLKISHKKRGVLTDDEVRGLLRWPGPFEDYRVYAINLLAFNTGLRIGEARGLLIEDIKGDHIVIQRSWEEGYGLKEPKFNQVRAVPIPKTTREAITQVIRDFEPERLVFYGKDKETPLSKTYILNGFRNAYVNMRAEADPKTRDLTKEELKTYRKNLLDGLKERGVGFHSWRHKLNTVLRAAGVPDPKIRLLTGHSTARMTDWYTQFLETDMADVTAAQAGLLKER